jgi:hypothetical protein
MTSNVQPKLTNQMFVPAIHHDGLEAATFISVVSRFLWSSFDLFSLDVV